MTVDAIVEAAAGLETSARSAAVRPTGDALTIIVDELIVVEATKHALAVAADRAGCTIVVIGAAVGAAAGATYIRVAVARILRACTLAIAFGDDVFAVQACGHSAFGFSSVENAGAGTVAYTGGTAGGGALVDTQAVWIVAHG